MASTPQLDLLMMDTHNSKFLAIGDGSLYPPGYNIISPTLEIFPPSFPAKSFPFTPRSVEIFNSYTLGITCSEDTCDFTDLPDGIYKLKYSIVPAYTYFIEKNFLRVDNLYKKLDTAYLKMDVCLDRRSSEKTLDEIEEYIEGAIAAANNCALKLSLQLYNKANTLLDQYNNKCNI